MKIRTAEGSSTPIADGKFDGLNISWINNITKPMKMKVQFSGTVDGNTMTGKAKAGLMGSFPFTAIRD